MADKDADNVLARELALFASNDGDIYRQRLQPFQLNYARRVVKGTFNKELGIKGLANNLARDVLLKYWKEFSPGARPPVMNQATKTAFGKEMLEEIMEGVEDLADRMKEGVIDMFGRARTPKKAKIAKKGKPKGNDAIGGVR